MSNEICVFTSVNNAYLPKARVLARSVKQFHPHWRFSLVLADALPTPFDLDAEPFDEVLELPDLGIENWKAWSFGHNVVELCTAVKGAAARTLLRRSGCKKIIYLDPDIKVYSSLSGISLLLDSYDIVLTPHLLHMENSRRAIEDNELSTLQHGVFNLGFFATRAAPEGEKFLEWWDSRLREYCLDDIPRGLFTDQKWCDLAPAFFSTLHILRDPGYNVATWNIAHRVLTRSSDGTFFAAGVPLRFYHFTGFDKGDGFAMLQRYAADQAAAHALWTDYRSDLASASQEHFKFKRWKYGYFSNGEPIGDAMRRLYRSRRDLQEAFPDPYFAEGLGCYSAWWKAELQSGSVVNVSKENRFGRMLRDVKKPIKRVISSLVAGRA